jgi:hypothetical protein
MWYSKWRFKKTQATAGEQAHIVTKLQYWSFLATED